MCSQGQQSKASAAFTAYVARTFLVIASAGGSGLTLRAQPTNTVRTAVATMFAFTGTSTTSGATASSARSAWAKGAASRACVPTSPASLVMFAELQQARSRTCY